MAHSQETRQAVRAAYIYDRLPLEEAAKQNGVSYNTTRHWKRRAEKRGDNWDRARAATQMAAGGLGEMSVRVLNDFAVLYQSTLANLSNDKEISPLDVTKALSLLADAWAKTVAACGKTNPMMAKLAVAYEVLELQGKWIADNRPEALETFTELLEPFGAYLNEVFEKQALR